MAGWWRWTGGSGAGTALWGQAHFDPKRGENDSREGKIDLITEALVEAHRLQLLSLIRRHAFLLVTPAALARLGDSLRIPTEDCWPLIEELMDEGFITRLPSGMKRYWTPLRLTAIGDGYLEWMRRRLIMGDPGEAAVDPLGTVN